MATQEQPSAASPADSKRPARNPVVQAARADWMERFEGAVKKKQVTFGSPTIKHFYKRSFDQTGRNCHFLQVFGRVLIGEEKIAPVEAKIYERITEVMTALERKVNASRAFVAQAEVEELAEFNMPTEVLAKVIVPAQNKFLKVLLLAEQYLVLVNTLWLEGAIPDPEKSKAELEVKQLLRGIVSTTRKMRVYLQDQLAKADETVQKAVAREVAVTGGLDEGPGADEDLNETSPAIETAAAIAAVA